VIDADWIIRIDPQTRQWEQLSSSRAREGKTPFIDGRRLERYQSVADPTRERILLAVNGSFRGFWTIEKDGTFVQINMERQPDALVGLFDNGKKLLYASGNAEFIYDFETGTNSERITWHGTTPISPWLQEDMGIVVGCVWHGHVWMKGWTRIRINSNNPMKIEHLPIPEMFTDRSSRWRSKFIAPTSDGKNLVVADDNEIVLLRFEEP